MDSMLYQHNPTMNTPGNNTHPLMEDEQETFALVESPDSTPLSHNVDVLISPPTPIKPDQGERAKRSM